MRFVRLLGVGVAATAMVAVALVALPNAEADGAEAALDRARTAIVREDFSGLVQIEWLSDGKWETARVPVSGTGGTVQVGEGTRKAEGRGNERWIAGVSGWQAGWDEPVSDAAVPKPSKHWDLTLTKGPDIAGRVTDVVTARDPKSDTARLKVYVDRNTGVMLRREVLNHQGKAVRSVGFVEVKKLGGTRAARPADPKTKGKAKDKAPEKVATLPGGYDAPRKVANTYVLAGRYLRDAGVVQLYYSDGLFGVSLFEQRGDLNWNGLPRGGGTVAIDGARGRGYEVAGGTVLVWEHDGVTYTVVSDATPRDLRTFAAAFDAGTDDDGGVIHDVTSFVLGPFGWD